MVGFVNKSTGEFYPVKSKKGAKAFLADLKNGVLKGNPEDFIEVNEGETPKGAIKRANRIYEEQKEESGPKKTTAEGRESVYGTAAKFFPYSADAALNGKKPGFAEGFKDVWSLPGRAISSLGGSSLGKTSEESFDGSKTGLIGGIARNPYVAFGGVSAPILAAAGGAAGLTGAGNLLLNMGLQGNLGSFLYAIDNATRQNGYPIETGGEAVKNTLLAGAGGAAGELVGQVPRLINARNASKLANAHEVYDPQERAIANIMYRGKKAYSNTPDADQIKIQNYNRRDVDNVMQGGIENLEQQNIAADNALNSLGTTPIVGEGSEIGTGSYRKPMSKSVSAIGKELSDEEIALAEQLATSKEEYYSVLEAGREALRANQDAKRAMREHIKSLRSGAKMYASNEAIADARARYQNAKDAYDRAIHTDEIKVVEGEEKALLDSYKEAHLANLVKRQQNRDAQNSVYEELGLTPKKKSKVQQVKLKTESAEEYLGNFKKPDVEGEMGPMQAEHSWEFYTKKNLDEAENYLKVLEEMPEDAWKTERGRAIYNDLMAQIREIESGFSKKAASIDENSVGLISGIRTAKQNVYDAKQALAEEGKAHRGKNIERGRTQLGENIRSDSPNITTNKFSEDFSKKLLSNLEKAEAKQNTSYKTASGAPARNASGVIIPPSDSRDVIRARDVASEFYALVMNRAKSNGLGTNVGFEPRIYNEDIQYAVQRMVNNNNYDFAEAILDACGWLTEEQKKSFLENAKKFKFTYELGKGYNDPKDFQTKKIGEGKLYDLKEKSKTKFGLKAAGNVMDFVVPDPRDVTFKDVQNAWETIQSLSGRKPINTNVAPAVTRELGLIGGVTAANRKK